MLADLAAGADVLERAVGQQAERAGGPLDDRLVQRPLGPGEVGRCAPGHVEQAERAAGEAERERRQVLAEVALAEPAERRRDRCDLAHQVAGGVDQVAAHLQQDQPGHRREIGLVGEAVGAQGAGVAVGEPQADRPADRAGVDLGAERAVPGAEPPVLVDHQADARRVAGVDHRQQVGPDERRRLLAEDVDAVPARPARRARGATRAACRSRRSRASRRPRTPRTSPRRRVKAVAPGRTPAHVEPLGVQVAERDQAAPGIAPARQVILRDEAAADQPASQRGPVAHDDLTTRPAGSASVRSAVDPTLGRGGELLE